MSGTRIAVFSGQGGVGKTTIVAAWGALAARSGEKVLLVDLNVGMRNLDIRLGLESRIVFDLRDVLEGLCSPGQAMVKERNSGLFLLSAPPFRTSAQINEDALAALTEKLAEDFKWIFLDTGPGIDETISMATHSSDRAVLLTRADDGGIRAAERIADLIRRCDLPSPELLINWSDASAVKEGLQYSPEVCGQVLDVRVLESIPEDPNIRRSSWKKEPALGNYPGAAAIENAWLRFQADDRPMLWQTGDRDGTATDACQCEQLPVHAKATSGVWQRLMRRKKV